MAWCIYTWFVYTYIYIYIYIIYIYIHPDDIYIYVYVYIYIILLYICTHILYRTASKCILVHFDSIGTQKNAS